MATTLRPTADRVAIPRKVWTRKEAHALVDLGFPNAEKLELIDGDLIDRMGKKHPHVLWQHLCAAWLRGVFGSDFVRTEAPTDVSAEDNEKSEPEPDLMVTSRSIRDYTESPSPEDLRLVLEISDSTLTFDLTVKAALYARAGIVEYWVISLPGKELIVHRTPSQGAYTNIVVYGFEDKVSPLAAPAAQFCMARL